LTETEARIVLLETQIQVVGGGLLQKLEDDKVRIVEELKRDDELGALRLRAFELECQVAELERRMDALERRRG